MSSQKASRWGSMGLGTKVFLFVLVGSIVSSAVTVVVARKSIETEASEQLIGKARAITQEAENARRYVAGLHATHNAFDKARLLTELKAALGDEKDPARVLEIARTKGFYYTIPVVAAWTVAEENAEKAGYKFRVPKISPRNPKNEPDPVEREMLEHLEKSKDEEIFKIDEATNSMRYMRPVTLTQECMLCHGTERDFPEGKGYDPLGFKMEGWKVGEVHGGFEVFSDLAPMQARVASTTRLLVGVGVALIAAMGALVYWYLRRSVSRPLAEAVDVLNAVASGDLTQEMEVNSRDEVGQMATALQQAQAKLRETLLKVRSATEFSTNASQELSAASQSLSSASQEQAASLEETAASLNQITESSRGNASAAEEARKCVAQSRQSAEKGGSVVQSTVDAMQKINASSKQIAAIITTIDEIAFQTNLLALNAAVEAARAGEQGKGFAVVASEVRNLAQRSASSAREIKSLIQDSVKKVEDGSQLVIQSGETLNEIIQSVQRVSELVNQIAEASTQEAKQIEQVNLGVTEIDRATQSNAAQTEELSSVAANLSSQSRELQLQVEQFNLGASGSSMPSSSKPMMKKPQTRVMGSKPSSPKPAMRSHGASTELSHSASALPAPEPEFQEL